MSAGVSANEPTPPVEGSARSRGSRARTAVAFAIALAGSALLDGWMTASSLVWLGWVAAGAAAGLVAGRARAIWVVPVATLLVFPIAAVAGRASRPGQPEPVFWAVLVVVGGMVMAAGFALGAAAIERRFKWIGGIAVLVGVFGLAVWAGYSGWVGSDEMALARRGVWLRCDNPRSMYGWEYEAINYNIADDARLEASDGGVADCPDQGEKAGTEVVTQDGTGIAGWYIPAGNGADATAPTFIISPGWKSNKSEVLKYAPFFHDRFNLVLLDLRNQGRSGGAVTTWGVLEKQDVRAIVDWLERTKHPSWIGATGNSMGAATVLAAAAEDPRIRALVLDSMHANVQDTFTDSVASERNLPGLPTAWFVVNFSSLRSGADIPSANPVGTIGQMGDRPVLLIHGTNDILDTVDHAAKPNLAAAEAAGVPVTMQYCEGGGHGGLVNKCPDQWQAWLDAFLATVPDLPQGS